MIDERFILHRYKATRFAMVIGMLAMAAWCIYQYIAKGVIEWDIFVILMAMAVSKIGAMIYYRERN